MAWITVNSETPKPTTFENLGYVQVVRCKDCKYFEEDYYCKKRAEHHFNTDWFCADGEKVVTLDE